MPRLLVFCSIQPSQFSFPMFDFPLTLFFLLNRQSVVILFSYPWGKAWGILLILVLIFYRYFIYTRGRSISIKDIVPHDFLCSRLLSFDLRDCIVINIIYDLCIQYIPYRSMIYKY